MLHYKMPPLLRLPLLACILVYTIVYVPKICANSADNYHIQDGLHVPCSFFETVNVTGDYKFPNGSYRHDGVIIPPYLIGTYNYIYIDIANRIDVEPHLRGCICKLKNCINFCCPWGTIYNYNISSCANKTDDLIQWPATQLNITISANMSLKVVNIFEQFAVQNFRPCESMYSLLPEINDFDAWHIFENGSLLRLDDMITLSKDQYCLMPTVVNDSDSVYIINPANCNLVSEFGTMKVIYAYAMLFSIPFMLLTIAVYLAIPELRNQHGKSLVCYLLGLIIGYSLLSVTSLFRVDDVTVLTCKIMGFTAYYFFMAAFFWLSVISFDLWHNFRGTHGVNRFKEKRRFLIYSLYAWGLAAVFLVLTWVAEEKLDIPIEYKPGIGSRKCWLEMESWSAMIYFFGPILLIIIANLIMFVMTALKIHSVQREMARIMAREDSTRNLRTEKDKFGLFLRLFIVMGVTWSMEIASYFVGPESQFSKVFYITDICNAIQGFIIFMLFVMKKKVKNLITNRVSAVRNSTGGQRQSQYSTKTTSSSVANLTMTEKPLMMEKPNGIRTEEF